MVANMPRIGVGCAGGGELPRKHAAGEGGGGGGRGRVAPARVRSWRPMDLPVDEH